MNVSSSVIAGGKWRLGAVLSLAAAWLLFPVGAAANDCPAGSELRECLQAGAYGPLAVLGLLGAALGGLGLAMRGAESSDPPPTDPPEPPAPVPGTSPPRVNQTNAGYDPGGINMGGSGSRGAS